MQLGTQFFFVEDYGQFKGNSGTKPTAGQNPTNSMPLDRDTLPKNPEVDADSVQMSSTVACPKHETTYVLVGHDRAHDRVAIVQIDGPDDAQLLMWDRQAFETAYSPDSGRPVISLYEPQRALPAWLDAVEGCTAEKIDGLRSAQSSRKHAVCIQQRLAPICALGEKLPEIFQLSDFQKKLNNEIRQQGKRLGRNLNVSRVRSQLLIWYAFGKQAMALFPAYTRCGSKTIAESDGPPVGAPKRGRPSTRGRSAGFNCDKPMVKAMEAGYRRHREMGTPVAVIYRKTLVSEFHCGVKTARGGRPRIVQRDGNPFPSESQFRYNMDKIFSKKEVRTGIYGSTKIRRTESASRGAYTDGVAYVGERIEFDAQVLDEHPVSFDGIHVLEKLHATEAIDVASCVIIGVGAGLGAEDTASHQAMQFSAAIPKVKFCSLFGVQIEADEWSCQGLPAGSFGDRGPGMSERFASKENALLRTFGRSFQGQDKPSIENSHEKSIIIEGQPVLRYANHNPVEVFKNEILRVIAHNKGADVSSRLTPEMVQQNVVPTPNGVHSFLISRGRSMLTQISFDEAVRRYLTPIEVTISSDGVFYNKLRFVSMEMSASGLLDYAKNHGSFSIKAFVLELCASTIWVETANGALIEVKFKPPLMEDADFLPMTHADTFVYANQFMDLQAQQKDVGQAAWIQYEQQCAEQDDIAASRNQPIPVKPGVVSKNATEQAKRATGS